MPITTAAPLTYYNNNNNNNNSSSNTSSSTSESIVINPVAIVIFLLIVILCVILFISLGKNNNDAVSGDNSGKIYRILGFIVVFILFILVIINVFQYFFNIDIAALFKKNFEDKKKVEITVDKSNESIRDKMKEHRDKMKQKRDNNKDQLFNIPGNYYNYENAKALCNAYDAKLATYEQIEDAYHDGGEWCNYGWSEGQMALFPTQQSTFDNLQKIKGHEHDCGRAGINGGYIANPKVKFGVNCYGKKPEMTSEEEDLMNNSTPYPETAEDIAFQKRVDYWKSQINNILVSPFSYGNWNDTK